MIRGDQFSNTKASCSHHGRWAAAIRSLIESEHGRRWATSLSRTIMPQRPYIPLGTLRRVATYPLPPSGVADDKIRQMITDVGLGHLMKSLDEDAAWDHVLSGGEKQRIAFARLFSHRPNLIIMDEATSSLDPASQTQVMNLLIDRLPDAAVVSIAHRPELEAFHNRKLIFEHRPGGSHLVSKNISMATEHIASLQPGKATRLRLLPAVES